LRSEAPVLLSLSGIEAGYGRIRALHGIDLEVRAGEIVTLLGANGAGKTTTLKTISGLVRATAGSIKLEGQELVGKKASDIARLGVVHVPEGRHVLRGLSVRENLELVAVRTEAEGAKVKLDAGFDARAVRLVGNVVGNPPFTGTLKHHGWKANATKFPEPPRGDAAKLLAPAEVELA